MKYRDQQSRGKITQNSEDGAAEIEDGESQFGETKKQVNKQQVNQDSEVGDGETRLEGQQLEMDDADLDGDLKGRPSLKELILEDEEGIDNDYKDAGEL